MMKQILKLEYKIGETHRVFTVGKQAVTAIQEVPGYYIVFRKDKNIQVDKDIVKILEYNERN